MLCQAFIANMWLSNDVRGGMELLRQNIKTLAHEFGTYADFYRHLYTREPCAQDVKSFSNFLNRGVFKAEFVQLLAEKTVLGKMTAHELFNMHLYQFLEKHPELEVTQKP